MIIRSAWSLLAAIHAAGPLGAEPPSSCSRQERASGTAVGRPAAGTKEDRLRFDFRDGMRGITVIPPPPSARLSYGYIYRDAQKRESLREFRNFLWPALRIVRAHRRKSASGHGGVHDDEQESAAVNDRPPGELQRRLRLL